VIRVMPGLGVYTAQHETEGCPCPAHGNAPCGRCSGCCGAEEYCCETPDLAAEAWKRDATAAEAKLVALRAALAVFAERGNWEDGCYDHESPSVWWLGKPKPWTVAQAALEAPAAEGGE